MAAPCCSNRPQTCYCRLPYFCVWFSAVDYAVAFSALTLLVGRQEGHPACKKWGDGGGGHWLAWMEWRSAGWLVCLPLLIFPCTIKSRSSLLVTAHPGGPGKRAVKRWWCSRLRSLSISFSKHAKLSDHLSHRVESPKLAVNKTEVMAVWKAAVGFSWCISFQKGNRVLGSTSWWPSCQTAYYQILLWLVTILSCSKTVTHLNEQWLT